MFLSDGNDSGRLTFNSECTTPDIRPYRTTKFVQCETLSTYLTKEVDFLKMNIEGAEAEVVLETSDRFHNVRETVIEYHSYKGQTQRLDELLARFRTLGFVYSFRHIFTGHDSLLNPDPA